MGVRSILNREVCIFILMSEHGEENIQTNIESFANLEKMARNIDLKKSTIKTKISAPLKEEKNVIRKPTFFKSSTSIKAVSDLEPSFVPQQKNSASLEMTEEERQFERALKQERNRRKNPLDLLGEFITKTKEASERLAEVGLTRSSKGPTWSGRSSRSCPSTPFPFS